MHVILRLSVRLTTTTIRHSYHNLHHRTLHSCAVLNIGAEPLEKGKPSIYDLPEWERPVKTYKDYTGLFKGKRFPRRERSLGDLVYQGPIHAHIKGVKLVSFTSSLLFFAAQPMLYKDASSLSPLLFYPLALFFGVFTYATPFALHYLLVRRYVVRLYYDEEEDRFASIHYGFFGRRYALRFAPCDVRLPRVPGMLTHLQVMRDKERKRSLFIDVDSIARKEAVERLLGFDKPVDFASFRQDPEAYAPPERLVD